MLQRSAPGELMDALGSFDRSRDWTTLGPAIGRGRTKGERQRELERGPGLRRGAATSCYELFLSVALRRSGEKPQRFACLRILSDVPAPSKASRLPFLLALVTIILTFGVIGALLLLDPVSVDGGVAVGIWFVFVELIGFVGLLFAIAIASIPMERVRMYRRLENVDPPNEPYQLGLAARMAAAPRTASQRYFLRRLRASITAIEDVREGAAAATLLADSESAQGVEDAAARPAVV